MSKALFDIQARFASGEPNYSWHEVDVLLRALQDADREIVEWMEKQLQNDSFEAQWARRWLTERIARGEHKQRKDA